MVMCFAWGCNTTEASEKAYMFSFPKDLSIRKQWINAINLNKQDFDKAKAPSN